MNAKSIFIFFACMLMAEMVACGQTTCLWTNGVSNAGSGNWGDVSAWNGSTWADAGAPPHNIARFSATNASYTVTNNLGTVFVGGLDFIRGPATLRGGTIRFGNNATNKNSSSQQATIYSILSADPGVDVAFGPGNQNWSIYTNLNIQGKILIDIGSAAYSFFLQADNVFTNTSASIILQRVKLDCRSTSGQNLTNRTVVLGGGVIWVNTGTLDLGDVRFDSLYTAGGTLSGNNKQINIRGRLIGNATNAVLSVSGANVDLYNPNAYTGGLALSIATACSVTMRATHALPLNTVVTNNGYLRLGTGSVSVVQELAGLAGTNGLVIGNASSVSTLVIINTTNYTYTGRLGGTNTTQNNIALTKTGAGVLTLSGTNTYAGATIISNGVLRLGTNGCLLGSPVVSVAGTAVFDVSALNGAFTVVPNQMLTGSGTVTGVVTIANGGVWAPGGVDQVGSLIARSSVTNNGTLLVDVNMYGSCDVADIWGDLVLGAGSVLNVAGSPCEGLEYTIAVTDGVVTGSFASDNLPAGWYVEYGAKSIVLKGPVAGGMVLIR